MSKIQFPAGPSPAEPQALLTALISASEDAILSQDLSGSVQSWNSSATRLFGYSPQEMVGRPGTVLVPPDRRDEEPKMLECLQRGQHVDLLQTVRIHKDGHAITVGLTMAPICDGGGRIVGAVQICRDISAMSALEGMFRAIISSSDDAIISKDLNGVIQSWNASATRIFGYAPEEMIGRPITVLFPPDRMDEEPRILEQIRRGQRVDHFETVRICKDGRAIDVSVTISPVKDASGRVIGVSKVARDITSFKRQLREREVMLTRETAARAEAERVGRMKDEFLSTLSHELRTPLNAILGWANILRAPDIIGQPEELQEGLETIERNARAQAQLIEELLDMSRIVNGKLRLDLRSVDLVAVIGSAIDSVRPAADARRIRITPLLDPKAGPITADPSRIQQILWNLLTNAIKFTPAGGKIQVLLQRVNSHLEITVADTGQGIPRAFLPHLFNRFSQVESSTTRHHGGLGLGLAIVKALVELHGGTVHASSPGPGKGSTFVVALPLAVVHESREAPAVHPQAEPPIGAPSELPDFGGFSVLVVDDETDARTLIQRLLQRCHVTVLTAQGADEALELVRHQHPNLILSDIGMPGQDGYELLRRVRALGHEEGGDTPAVAITAFARSEDRRRALAAGFQMHVPKPIEPAELIAIVANHVIAQRRAAARV